MRVSAFILTMMIVISSWPFGVMAQQDEAKVSSPSSIRCALAKAQLPFAWLYYQGTGAAWRITQIPQEFIGQLLERSRRSDEFHEQRPKALNAYEERVALFGFFKANRLKEACGPDISHEELELSAEELFILRSQMEANPWLWP